MSMERRAAPLALVTALLTGAPAAFTAAEPGPAVPIPDAAALKRLSARLAPVDLVVDLGPLAASERAALAKIVEAKGKLLAVPCSLAYQPELERAAQLLREAAALTSQPRVRLYLETRAAAFLSNDYYESDVVWMKLDASIEPTIGPYEVYEDGWFNAKAAFEAFVTLRDEAFPVDIEPASSRSSGCWPPPPGAEPVQAPAGAAGCCWLRQWSVPSPQTRSRAWMPTTGRSRTSSARIPSATRSRGSLKVGTSRAPFVK